MFSDVLSCFRCSQLFSDVLRMPSIDHRFSIEIPRCAPMVSDDHRCFWIFSRYSIDVLLMLSRCFLDVPRMFAGCFQDAPMGLLGLVEFDDQFK